MADSAYFHRRTHELKHKQNLLADLDKEVRRFIRQTDKYTLGTKKVEFALDKHQETINDLLKLEAYIDDYMNHVHRMSRVKVRHWEQDALRGHKSEIVGDRRAIIRNLKQLRRRVVLLRKTISLVKPSDHAVVLEQTIQQAGNFLDIEAGKFKTEAGGDIIFCVTALLAIFVELVIIRRKKTE